MERKVWCRDDGVAELWKGVSESVQWVGWLRVL